MSLDFKNMSDEELFTYLMGSKNQARIAFDELYTRYSSKIFTYCCRILGDRDLAEDVFQDTFLKFYESSKEARDMTNVPAFLFKIARNLCINEKQKKYHQFVPLEEFSLPSFNDSYDSKETANLIDIALESLPDKYREVLVMKEFLGFSYKEIADILGTTMPSVRIKIYRAKNKARKILSPYLEDFQE